MKRGIQAMFPLQAGGGKIEGGLVYKGTVSSASDLPSSSEVEVGWLYIADTAFTLNSEQIEIGDELYWNGTTWNVVQGNITPVDVGYIGGKITINNQNRLIVDGVCYNGKLVEYPDISHTNFSCSLYAIENGVYVKNYSFGTALNGVSGTLTFASNSTFNNDVRYNYYVVVLYKNGNSFAQSSIFQLPAKSISQGDKGFTTGDQVATYVAEHGFDPSSMETIDAIPTLVGMEDIENALASI